MTVYRNLGGDSNVASFTSDLGWIRVTFKDDATYEYTTQSAGEQAVLEMIQCAESGQGLNGYINAHAKKLYSSKSR
jgi:phosphotransferase system IIB component